MGAFNEVCLQPVTLDRAVDKADGLRWGMVLSHEDWPVRGGPLCSTVEGTSGFVPETMGR